jgi:hypothetical protein
LGWHPDTYRGIVRHAALGISALKDILKLAALGCTLQRKRSRKYFYLSDSDGIGRDFWYGTIEIFRISRIQV